MNKFCTTKTNANTCPAFLIYQQETLGKQIKESTTFSRDTGVVYKALEDTLQSLNVKRQAYHSHSFVGNHIDICLKVDFVNKNKT